jgi:hypothetical protein
MDNVIKVAAVPDKSDKGGSGVNNNFHYDGADGHRGGTSATIQMDKESMVWETLPPPSLQVVVIFGGSQEAVGTQDRHLFPMTNAKFFYSL